VISLHLHVEINQPGFTLSHPKRSSLKEDSLPRVVAEVGEGDVSQSNRSSLMKDSLPRFVAEVGEGDVSQSNRSSLMKDSLPRFVAKLRKDSLPTLAAEFVWCFFLREITLRVVEVECRSM
jgi:hypothetical protein